MRDEGRKGTYTHVGGAAEAAIKAAVRDVPDFPKPGIIFKDIAPVTGNAVLFRQIVGFFVERYRQRPVNSVVAVESRGFIFGAPVAYELGVPFHMARKKGKLPYTTVDETYDLEYGSATVELHTDAVCPGDRVLVIDDLLATGGTVQATARLVERLGGTVVECAFLIELGFLNGSKKLDRYDVCTVVKY